MRSPGVEFLTRVDCPLCEAALRLVEEAAQRYGVAVVITDVDLDLSLLAAFDHRVPVIRDAATGTVLAEGMIDRAAAVDAVRAVSP